MHRKKPLKARQPKLLSEKHSSKDVLAIVRKKIMIGSKSFAAFFCGDAFGLTINTAMGPTKKQASSENATIADEKCIQGSYP
jgi:hypothetical protein